MQKTKWARSPSNLAPSCAGSGRSSWGIAYDAARLSSVRAVFKRARGQPESLCSGGDPLRTGLVVRPRESASDLRTKRRLAFNCRIGNQEEWPRSPQGERTGAAIACFPMSCWRVRRKRGRNSTCPEIAGYTHSAATDHQLQQNVGGPLFGPCLPGFAPFYSPPPSFRFLPSFAIAMNDLGKVFMLLGTQKIVELAVERSE